MSDADAEELQALRDLVGKILTVAAQQAKYGSPEGDGNAVVAIRDMIWEHQEQLEGEADEQNARVGERP